MTNKEVGEYFRLSTRNIENCLLILKWIHKKNNNMIPTKLGLKHGATESYNVFNNQRYTIWTNDIMRNQELINQINTFKSPNQKITLSPPKKSEPLEINNKSINALLYKKYISILYQMNDYKIWENTNKNKYIGIDLIVRKGNKIVIIKCQAKENSNITLIKDTEIKAFRSDAHDFTEENPMFLNYELHLKFILSDNFIHESAIAYINNCNKNISYKILKKPTID